MIALQGGTLDALLKDTVRLVAEGLPAEFCKVLEFSNRRTIVSPLELAWAGSRM